MSPSGNVKVEFRVDRKPSKRIRDTTVYGRFFASERVRKCIACGHDRVMQAHHILHRSQGGDDVLANLAPLCSQCHGALHGTPYQAFGSKVDAGFVRRSLARFVRSEPGQYAALYLSAKLGAEGAVAFLERLEA